MSYNVEGISQIAMMNKRKLRQKYFMIPIAGAGIEYKFKISNVSPSFIKIEKFFYYSDIIKAVLGGNHLGFEYALEQVILDPSGKTKPSLDNSSELREIALANKSALKNKYISLFIGVKEYDFRISGIGSKSIKIEIYVAYDDIARELSSGNDISLEYIVLEVMMGNTVDYSKFYQFFDEDELIFDDDSEDETDEVDIDTVEKLSEDEIDEVDIDTVEKLSEEELDEKMSKLRGWQKLVFDSIEDILEEEFTLNTLLDQNRIKSYQTIGEDLENKVLDNLIQLIDMGLVVKVNKNTYVKLWD